MKISRTFVIILLVIILGLVAAALAVLLIPNFSIYNVDDSDEVIGLAQFLVGLAAVAAIGLAALEFFQSQRRPSLRFAFLGEDGLLHDEYEISLPVDGGRANRITFAVENTGDAIAVWWQVRFDLPVRMMRRFRMGEGRVFVRHRQVPLMMDTVGDVERYVAQSTGTVGLFPGPPVQVAIVEVDFDSFAGSEFEAEYPIGFQLLTDQSGPVNGEIPLRIQAPDAEAANNSLERTGDSAPEAGESSNKFS